MVPPQTAAGYVLTFAESASGLAVLALLIAYLPTIYSAFSRRELLVAKLAVRAGTPPTAVELIERYHAIGWNDQLAVLWATWEDWFAEIAETHTTFAVLAFFRSPNPDRSWITAAGAVLDGAALANSTLSIPWSPRGRALHPGRVPRAAASSPTSTGSPYNPDPTPDGPISISREEFDEAYRRLGGAGVPIRPDHERAWRDFAGWRGQLRLGAARPRRPDHGAVRAVVVRPVAAGAPVADHQDPKSQVSRRPGRASRRMNHSTPKLCAKNSGGDARKNESSGIWLACAAMAARFCAV